MFDTIPQPERHTRQLNLSGGRGVGGKGTEYLLIGALAVVIIGSLVLTFYFGMGGRKSARGRAKLMFQCSECDAVFELDPKTISRKDMGPEMGAMGMGIMRPDCPKCGAKKSGQPMVQCPKCKKYYVSPRLNWNEITARGGRPEGDPPKDICPYCGTDRVEWYRKLRKSRKK